MKNTFYLTIFLYCLFPNCVCSQTFRSEIIKHISHTQIKGNNLIRTDSCILQINERMGDYDAEIHIPYTKGDKLSIQSAWIEDKNGNIVRKLKKSEIEDRSYVSSAALYEDDFVKSFELKHNTYPYRIHYNYKITYSKYLYAVYQDYLYSRIPIRHREITLTTDAEHPINYMQKNTGHPEIDSLENTITYKWVCNYTPPKNREANSSVNSSKAPQIKAVPLKFKYGNKGNKESWVDFGNWVYSLNKGRDELPASEKKTIARLIRNAETDKEKAEILYKYMQDYTRYIFVNVNIGGFQSYPASYVCANRYGDCKALTNYMQAILNHIGIKSYYTLINAGDEIEDIDMDFPSQVFNHAILTVPLENDTVFLECTSKNTPFGYMGTFTQGRKGLMIIEDNSRFIDIPALSANDVLCTRNISIDLNTSELKMSMLSKGENYVYLNSLAASANKKDTEKFIHNNILSGSYDLLNYEFTEIGKQTPSIKLDALCKIHNTYKKYGNNLIVNLYPVSITNYEAPDKRMTDVQLNFPEHYKDTVTIHIGDISISKMPEPVLIESEYGKYSINYEQEGNKIHIYKDILIKSGRYTLQQYPDFYKFIMSVINNENKNLYLEIQ